MVLVFCTACIGCAFKRQLAPSRIPDALAEHVHVRSEGGRGVLYVDTRVAVLGNRPDVLPLHWREGMVCVPARARADASPQDLELVVDTGAPFTVVLSPATAHELRPWTFSGELRYGKSLAGQTARSQAVLTQFDIGTSTFSPLRIQLAPGSQKQPDILGIGILERFTGVIFDWERQRLIVLPRSSRGTVSLPFDGAANPGWASARWSRDDDVEPPLQAGLQARITLPAGRHRWVTAEVAGHKYRAVLDTGAIAELFAFARVPVKPGGTISQIEAFGQTQSCITAPLAEPLVIAGLRFDNLVVDRFKDESDASPEPHDADLIIGLGVLQKHPIWLDFAADTVRFWTAGSLPNLIPDEH